MAGAIRRLSVLGSTALLLLAGCGADPVASPPITPRAASDTPTTVPPAPASPPSTPADGPTKAERIAALKPAIVQRPIPFGQDRRADMRAYSKRHYGDATARLSDPRVVVLHYTVTPTFEATYNVFAPNRPDASFGELPGLCTHFVIDTDGTIYQLVPLALRCRHTVGLNWTAIGIEHVGNRDADVVDRTAVRRASLRLVRWLQCRYDIDRADVIGHAESLTSPYHRERVASMADQTHEDLQPATMRRYRALLRPCPGSGR